MDNFQFPKNVKQIGSIGKGLKIYLEDYAYSYLQQYSNSGDFEERIAVLIGRALTIDGQKVLFISGAIQGVNTRVSKGIMTFTDKSWNYSKEQIKKYFKGLEVVGWVISQPGYGTSQNSNNLEYHFENFKKSHQVMFVMDPKDKVNAFYTVGEKGSELTETKGYFVYFEKNNGMHEYMLNNKIVTLKKDIALEAKFKSSQKLMEAYNEAYADEDEEEYENEIEMFEDYEADEEKTYDKTDFVEFKDPISMLVKPSGKRREVKPKERTKSRRKLNMLTTLASVLLVVCFIMGAGLMQNETRITTLESQLTLLNTSYRNLLVKLNDSTQSVFSTQHEELDEEAKSNEIIIENGNDIVLEVPENEFVVIKDFGDEDNEEEPIVENEVEEVEEVQSEDTTAMTAAIPEFYIVQKGDSLGYISLKFYGTRNKMEDIMTINEMDDPDKLYFGRKIKLPLR
jgi:LysM repeat protein